MQECNWTIYVSHYIFLFFILLYKEIYPYRTLLKCVLYFSACQSWEPLYVWKFNSITCSFCLILFFNVTCWWNKTLKKWWTKGSRNILMVVLTKKIEGYIYNCIYRREALAVDPKVEAYLFLISFFLSFFTLLHFEYDLRPIFPTFIRIVNTQLVMLSSSLRKRVSQRDW